MVILIISNIWWGILIHSVSHVGGPFPIHGLAGRNLQSWAPATLRTWSWLSVQCMWSCLKALTHEFCLQRLPPLIPLTKPYSPILKHWLKVDCEQAFPNLPLYLINSPAELLLLAIFLLTLLIE